MTDPPPQIEATRIAAVVADVVARLASDLSGDGDEHLFQKHYGPEGSFRFWANFLSGVVGLPHFIHVLSLMRSERWNRTDMINEALQAALVDAYQGDEPIFRGDLTELRSVSNFRMIKNPELIKVLGQKAAVWLVSSPRWRHLAPDTLTAFVRGERPKPDVTMAKLEKLPKVKPGPKGALTIRAAAAMLADLRSEAATVASLRNEKGEALAARYGVRSRSTAVKALKMALSEFAGHTNSDK